jgi:hypothetical protein
MELKRERNREENSREKRIQTKRRKVNLSFHLI